MRSSSAPNAVRITGGALRGRLVGVPRSARPTEGRVREALFSIWRDRLPGARVLDLFAGSGVVALEAMSRGADQALCVEGDAAAFRLLESNCRQLGGGAVKPWRANLPGGLEDLARQRGQFDLIYADPPYTMTAHQKLLVAAGPLLSGEGEMVLEHSSRQTSPEQAGDLERFDQRRYGESQLSFYRRRSAPNQEGKLLERDPEVNVFERDLRHGLDASGGEVQHTFDPRLVQG